MGDIGGYREDDSDQWGQDDTHGAESGYESHSHENSTDSGSMEGGSLDSGSENGGGDSGTDAGIGGGMDGGSTNTSGSDTNLDGLDLSGSGPDFDGSGESYSDSDGGIESGFEDGFFDGEGSLNGEGSSGAGGFCEGDFGVGEGDGAPPGSDIEGFSKCMMGALGAAIGAGLTSGYFTAPGGPIPPAIIGLGTFASSLAGGAYACGTAYGD